MIGAVRLLNAQGIAGLAIALSLAILLVVQKAETRHFRKESARFEILYRNGEASRATLVATYAAAADKARSADRANAVRVAAAQQKINRSSLDDYEKRLADARARAQRLRDTPTPDDRSNADRTTMPGLPTATGRIAEATGQDGFPGDDRLLATEQAIQLNELIKWVRAQSAIDPQGQR
jgi:hypothetical protein